MALALWRRDANRYLRQLLERLHIHWDAFRGIQSVFLYGI